MREDLTKFVSTYFSQSPKCGDWVAFSDINFKTGSFETFKWHLNTNGIHRSVDTTICFDLASLTKALSVGILSVAYAEKMQDSWNLLLNHSAGLPANGVLAKSSWKEQILNYEIRESHCVYSDLSSIRLGLEFEKELGKSLEDLVCPLLGGHIYYWRKMPKDFIFPITGERAGKAICAEVHDPKAYLINQFVAHAGLFATIEGLSQGLLHLDKTLGLLKKMHDKLSAKKEGQRFVLGMDTPSLGKLTLAGEGASKFVFGHLGFSGTSFWIDSEKERGHCLLTNQTKNYWYQTETINQLRRDVGRYYWSKI